jgi:hypothetical protein
LGNARVIAFELDPFARHLLRKLAALNDTSDRLTIHRGCTPDTLEGVLIGVDKALVICDTDGYEHELLDPELVPSLKHANLIVETHDYLRPGITNLLVDRFARSHHLEIIDARPRTLDDYPGTRPAHSSAVAALDEIRPAGQKWLIGRAF